MRADPVGACERLNFGRDVLRLLKGGRRAEEDERFAAANLGQQRLRQVRIRLRAAAVRQAGIVASRKAASRPVT